jgi:hypothetical protein
MGDGPQLLDVHLDAAVARHVNDEPVRTGHLGADGGGKALLLWLQLKCLSRLF